MQKRRLNEWNINIFWGITTLGIEVSYDLIVRYAEVFEIVGVLGGMWHWAYELKEGVPVNQNYFYQLICLSESVF